MEQLSYWHQTQKTREYPRLEGDLETDVLIVGGGMSGISAAYCLAHRGIHCAVIEAETLCAGTTGNTTGKMTLQHGIIYSNLMAKYGIDAARQFAKSQAAALNFAAETVRKYGINCQMEDATAYMCAMTQEEKDMLLGEYEAAKRMDIMAEWVPKPTFPPKCKALLGYMGQAVIHPVRYVQGLANAAQGEGAKIYTHTKAVRVTDGDTIEVALENGAHIRCRHLVQATQYPIYDGPNAFFTRLYARRDHGVAMEMQGKWPDGAFINIGQPVRSIRSHMENGKRVLILVGESHFPGREEEQDGLPHDRLAEFGRSFAGDGRVLAKWSAQDYETPDQIPYIGRLSDNCNIYVATGFNKWGLLSGTLAGMMLSELIDTGRCRYQELYARDRADISGSFQKAAGEVVSAIGELVKSKFEKTEDADGLEMGEGRSIRFRGKRAGVYRDDSDHVTVLDITCTHMGTELNFNAAERTWDCPAHGGRFRTDGKLIEGPPKDNLKILFAGSYGEFMNAAEGTQERPLSGAPSAEEGDRPPDANDQAAFNDMPPGPAYYHYPSHPPRGGDDWPTL